MLNSLEIRNYRNLRHLTIEKLGRVNLLVGKNNTGKTSVLEALAIYAEQGNELSTMRTLLRGRGEFYADFEKQSSVSENSLSSLKSIFTDRKINFYDDGDTRIYIGEKEESKPDLDSLCIGLVASYATSRSGENGIEYNEYIVADSPEQIEGRESRVEVQIIRNIFYRHRFSINDDLLFAEKYFAQDNDSVFHQHVNAKNDTSTTLQRLWAKVALTEGEEELIKALRIVESDIVRFSLVGEGRPIVRLKNKTIQLLLSMGDGVKRVLSIMLALLNCEKNGYLLIDEFENGLHYSVQEKLWEIIFYLADRLDIQVFATTHSNDTIKAFGEVANSKPDYSNAQLIQLRNVNNEISAVLFDNHDVEVATETDYLDLR